MPTAGRGQNGLCVGSRSFTKKTVFPEGLETRSREVALGPEPSKQPHLHQPHLPCLQSGDDLSHHCLPAGLRRSSADTLWGWLASCPVYPSVFSIYYTCSGTFLKTNWIVPLPPAAWTRPRQVQLGSLCSLVLPTSLAEPWAGKGQTFSFLLLASLPD